MSDREIAILSAFFSLCAVFVPIIIYWISQKRGIKIAGRINGPLNSPNNKLFAIKLIFEARNVGKKPLNVNSCIVISPCREIKKEGYYFPSPLLEKLDEDEVSCTEWETFTDNLHIDEVFLIDSTKKKWSMPRDELNALVKEVNDIITHSQAGISNRV